MTRIRIGQERTYICPFCNKIERLFRKVEDKDEPVYCEPCQEEMKLTNPGGKPYWKPFTPYFHIGLDQYFQTRSDENSYAKKNGLVDITGCFKDISSFGNNRRR